MCPEDTMMQSTDNGGVFAVCPKKKNDKNPVVFYEDRMTFNGETILYRDIDIVNMSGNHTTVNYLFENYSASVKFRLKDGRKLKWKVSGIGVFGISGIKAKKQYFNLIFEATLRTACKIIASKYIDQIKVGGTLKLAGLTIDPHGITGKHVFKTVTVPFEEINHASIDNGNVYIIGTNNKAVVNGIQVALDNAPCLLYVINSLAAGAQAETASAQTETSDTEQ